MMAEGRKDRSVERAIWLLLSLFFSFLMALDITTFIHLVLK